uniref:Immunoglobulin V-set domain-containing protein n=1 Tax=Equus caballus TaxID=9796 RepID=A0A3Q2HGY3_HORSE
MEFGLSWVFLVTILKGVQCEVQLVESWGRLGAARGSLTLSCPASGFTISSYWTGWIHQDLRKRLQWVSTFSSMFNTYHADSVKGSFILYRDNTKNTLCLQMNNLRVEDTAVYHSARHTVRGAWWEPRHKPPCRETALAGLQGALSPNRRHSGPPEQHATHLFRLSAPVKHACLNQFSFFKRSCS